MSMNKTKRVYVVINGDDQLEICASRESLEKYLDSQLKRYEKSLNKDRLKPELKRVKTFCDEEYEISVDIPAINYEVIYEDIDISITASATHPKVWVVYLRIPEVSNSEDYSNVIKYLIRFRDLPRIHLCKKLLFPKKAILEWIEHETVTK